MSSSWIERRSAVDAPLGRAILLAFVAARAAFGIPQDDAATRRSRAEIAAEIVSLTADGPATRATWRRAVRLETAGHLVAWAESAAEGPDLSLELSDADGRVAAFDDDGAGGSSPCIVRSLPGPFVGTLELASKSAAPCDAKVRIAFRPSSSAAAALVARLEPAARRANTEADAGRYAEAAATAEAVLRDVLAFDGAADDRAVLALLDDALIDVVMTSSPSRLRAAEFLREALSAMLPPGHVEIADARLGVVCARLAADVDGDTAALAEACADDELRHRPREFRRRARALRMAGYVHQYFDRPKNAVASYEACERALEAATDPDDVRTRIFVRISMATQLAILKRRDAALATLTRAEEDLPKAPTLSRADLFFIRSRIAKTVGDAGDQEKSWALYQPLLREAKDGAGLPPGEVRKLSFDAALFAFQLGDPKTTAELAERVRAFPPTSDATWWDEYDAMTVVAQAAYADLGEADRTLRIAEEWRLDARPRTPPTPKAASAVRLAEAVAAVVLGDHARAREACEAILAMPRGKNEATPLRLTRSAAAAILVGARRSLGEAISDDDAAALFGGRSASRPDGASATALERAVEGLASTALRSSSADERKRLESAIALLGLSPGGEARYAVTALRQALCFHLVADGDLDAAGRLLDRELERLRRTSSPSDPQRLLFVQLRCLVSSANANDAPRHADDVEELFACVAGDLRSRLLKLSARESAAAAARSREALSIGAAMLPAIGDAARRATLTTRLFERVESARAAPATGAGLLRVASRSPEAPRIEEARAKVARMSARAAKLAGSPAKPEVVAAAIEDRERAEREFVSLVAEGPAAAAALAGVDARRLAARLRPSDAYVGFWRRAKIETTPQGIAKDRFEEAYAAFVLRREGAPTIVELGSATAVDRTVRDWRATLGASGARGVDEPADRAPGTADAAARFRSLVCDPLRAAAPDATRWIVAPDGDLHLAPFEAAPLAVGLLGDVVHMAIVESALDLDHLVAAPPAANVGGVVVVGGVDYDADDADAPESRATTRPNSSVLAALRGGEARDAFAPLPATEIEADVVAETLAAVPGLGNPRLLKGATATKEAFAASASRARVLHVATHGFFAPDRFRSLEAPSRREAGVLQAAGTSDVVMGFAPQLLCGLAFAGANRADDRGESERGVMTAEEISSLDLAACELAVLSACETGIGHRRASGDLASLRRALHAAGARHAVTALWKVPDDATRRLMTDFYRRRFADGASVHEALRAAQAALRDSKDPVSGRALYGPSDWAAWVVTGPPD